MRQYFNREKYKTTYTIDKEKHPDSEVINFLGRKMTLGEIRSQYAKFDERKYKMISFYDDIFQYTSLGLYDLICDKYKLNDKIPIKAFFNRTEVDGIDFVVNTINKLHPEIGLTKEIAKTIERENYDAIISRSPFSKNFDGLCKIRETLSHHMMVFKYKFDGYDAFLKSISERVDTDYTTFEPVFLNGASDSELYESIPESRYSYFDMVVCNNAKALFDFIMEKNIQEVMLLTPINHNGVPPEDLALYSLLLEGTGPNNSQIQYISEEIR